VPFPIFMHRAQARTSSEAGGRHPGNRFPL